MSEGRSATAPTYADLALDRFRTWPLKAVRADSPPGRALTLPGRQILHFHRPDEAELHLTLPLVRRLAPVLDAAPAITLSEAAPWIRIRLDSASSLSLLESLTSLAIQANTAGHALPALCPHGARPARPVRGAR